MSSPSSSSSSRSDVLRRYRISEAAPERESFDDITRLAAHVFEADAAQLSLVGVERVWHTSYVGRDDPPVRLDASIGAPVVEANERTVVEDASRHERWSEHPQVAGDPGLRFVAGVPIRTPDGHAVGALCVMKTEPLSPPSQCLDRLEDLASLAANELEYRRKRTGRSPEKELEGLSRAIDQAKEAVLITEGAPLDPPGPRIVYANPAFEDMTGYAEAEVLGETPRLLQGPKTDRETLDRLRAQLEAGEPWSGEAVNYRKDGTSYVVQWNTAPMYNEDGEIIYWVSLQRDVTERRQTEEALREREVRLRGLANSIPGVIFQFYARPDGAYGFHFVSEQAGSLLGIDPDTGSFDAYLDRVPDGHRDALIQSIRDAVGNEEKWYHEIPYDKPSGERIWVHGISVPEPRENELVFNGVLLDITERKQLASQLRRAQKMEMVGTLAGGVAHDFNNILHTVTTYLEMAAEGAMPDSDVATFIRRARRGLDRGETLIDQLLTVGRQQESTERTLVDLEDAVHESLELISASLSKQIDVRTDLEPGCTAWCDSGQLQQILLNLAKNAGEALVEQQEKESSTQDAAGPKLEIRAEEVQVDDALAGRSLDLDPGSYARLTVSDNGPGMDANTREHIFEPFFTTKEERGGTGLGLAMVYGMTADHGGTIDVQSRPGVGTTFNVYLPSRPPESSGSGLRDTSIPSS